MANDQSERTEEATERRKSKERDKGNISKSQDFTSSLLLSCGLGFLCIQGNNMLSKMQGMLEDSFSNLKPENISNNDFISVVAPYFMDYIDIIGLFFVVLSICAILILRLQTGALFAKEALKPRFDKLKPSSAMKQFIDKINIFKPRQMVEFVKSIIKLIAVIMIGFKVVLKRRNDLLGLLGADPTTGFVVISSVILEIFIDICILLILIGFLDKKYQDYEYRKSIKMTKEEVKEERKQTDGDPKVKGKIRSFQMKIMQQKMMSKVKEADVVVVNPTHFAVALMYNPAKAPAPVVLAKGVDFVAFKIREIAKNNNIPIVENKPLARSLYKMVEVDQIIPQELYVAVAEILRYVQNQKNK